MDIYPERHVVYGVAYEDADLEVNCGRCKAPEGVPCTGRGKSHVQRGDKARNRWLRKTSQLHSKLENQALRNDPHGPLWTFTTIPHVCAVLGAHVATDCPKEDPK